MSSLAPHDGGGADAGLLEKLSFEVDGVDVEAGCSDNDVVAAPSEAKLTRLVLRGEIPGCKPLRSARLDASFGPGGGGDDIAPDEDLAF